MKILITGGTGMLGSAVLEAWKTQNPLDEVFAPSSDNLDLTDADLTMNFLREILPDQIIHCASKVDGIEEKIRNPSPYLTENIAMDFSVIKSAIELKVPNLLYVSSAVVYPKNSPVALAEEKIFAGPLEEANESYALAKLAAMKLCQIHSQSNEANYKTIIPSNLYGPAKRSKSSAPQFLSAVVSKISNAVANDFEEVTIWGDGQSKRELTHSQDVADWLSKELRNSTHWPAFMNVGSGLNLTVEKYYEEVGKALGFRGQFRMDESKPNGARIRLLDSSRAEGFGWKPKIDLAEGIKTCISN